MNINNNEHNNDNRDYRGDIGCRGRNNIDNRRYDSKSTNINNNANKNNNEIELRNYIENTENK